MSGYMYSLSASMSYASAIACAVPTQLRKKISEIAPKPFAPNKPCA